MKPTTYQINGKFTKYNANGSPFRAYDAHVHAWRQATCPGSCWRCKQATRRLRVHYGLRIEHPVLGEGRESRTIHVCPQKGVAVYVYIATDYGYDGGCQNGGVSGANDLVSRDAKPPW
jgi:hypothetical protein